MTGPILEQLNKRTMKIKGKYSLPTDVKTLWPMLQDETVLARISPGVSRIEKVGEDRYKAISDISIGPVRGSFDGVLTLLDKKEPEAMTMKLEQKSKIGNAEASISMRLFPVDNQTLIEYDGVAKVSGKLATMGQRILGGVITNLSKQVFKELEKILSERGTDPLEDFETEVKSARQSDSKEQEKKSFLQILIEKILNIWR